MTDVITLPERKVSVNEMYEKYGKTSNEEISELLSRIIPVFKTHKGEGTTFGPYQIGEELLAKVKEKPRNTSFTFADDEKGEYRDDIKPYRSISVLVKSSSRFFLKPDIGEVFDQMSDEEKVRTKAICLNTENHLTLDDTNGEHFVLQCTLYE